MRIGVSVATDIRNSDLGVYAEQLGFDTFWGTDSQMIWSDVYSYLALVASKTTRISIGPLVAVAPTRLAPVTAQSIATINRLAPGRTILGVGTAHTAMRTMGMKPMPARQFGEYLRVVRALLHDEEVEYELNGTSNPIQFMHRSLELIALYPTIPIYVSAMGPRTQRLAGQYGDGVISGNPSLESMRQNLAEGAALSGRVLPVGFSLVKMGAVAVVMPGEAIDSDFVVDCVGPAILGSLHAAWHDYTDNPETFVPPPNLEPVWEQSLQNVEARGAPASSRYRDVHEGHGTYVTSQERPLLTEEVIRRNAVVGEPDEIIERVRQIQTSGVTDYILRLGSVNVRGHMDRFIRYVRDAI